MRMKIEIKNKIEENKILFDQMVNLKRKIDLTK